MNIIIRDRNQELIDEFKKLAYAISVGGVVYECGNVFSDTDEEGTAFVSPANSFGYMDGGIDRVYCDTIGWHLQDILQEKIKKDTRFGELLIGEAIIVGTGNDIYPWMISAPTMRLPGVTNEASVFLATRAAVYLALEMNIKRLVIPGMGTGTGRVPFDKAAFAMHNGIIAARNKFSSYRKQFA